MRETLIYGLAFLLILGAGAYLILPQLSDEQEPVDEGPALLFPEEGQPDPGTPQVPEGPAAPVTLPDKGVALLEQGLTAWPAELTVSVAGEGAPLRGPLKDLVGAELVSRVAGEAETQRLTIRPTAPAVSFGAVGHQWVRVGIGALTDGMTVTLPAAAPTLVVRVAEPDGRPAVGVPVRVLPPSPLGLRRTDDGGTIVLDDLTPGNVIVDLTSRERSGPLLRLRTGVDREVEAVLDRGWRVRGSVILPGGKPATGFTVEAFAAAGRIGQDVTTDANGRFEWTGPVVARAAFRFRDAAWAELAVEATPPAVGDLRTDLGELAIVGPGGSIDVKVHRSIPDDAEAIIEVEPQVADAVRELFGSGQVLDTPRRLRAKSGDTVRFTGLPIDIPLRVSVRGAGIPVDGLATPGAGEDITLVMAPPAGHVIAGIVARPDGSPVAGARVLISREAREGDLRLAGDREVFTGVGGGFQLFGEVSRTVFLRAYVPGHRGLLRRVELPLTEPLALTLEALPEGPAHTLTGRVRDDRGTPLEGVTVSAAGLRTQTDATGRFTLTGVASTAPILRVAYGYEAGAVPASAPHPRDFAGRAFADIPAGTEKVLDLILARAVRLRMQVADAADDTPLTSLHVMARASTGRILFDRPVATRNGHVVLPALSPFDHARLHTKDAEPRNPVRSGGLRLFLCTHDRRHQMEIPLESGGELDLGRVLLQRGMHIRGVVKTPGGRPIPFARVAGMDAGWQSRGSDPEREREMAYRSTRADADGRFELRGFNPRRGANLVVWGLGRPPVSHNVLLPPFSDDVTADVEIEVPAGGYLLLILEDQGTKRAIEGAMMDVEYAVDGVDYLDLLHHGAFAGAVGSTPDWAIASQLLLFATPERGNYRLGPLRPGPYELWIERPGYEAERMRLTLPARGETFFDTVTHLHRDRAGKTFRPKSTIAFEGNTLRLIIPMAGQ